MDSQVNSQVKRATLIGLLAILLWSTSVGLIRSLTEALGPIGGASMIYLSSGLILCLVKGLPKIKGMPKRYLYICGPLFVFYEIALSLSIGFGQGRQQALELGLINYLWPCLTILFSVLINRQRFGLLLWPGALLAFLGIGWAMVAGDSWSFSQFWSNVMANPIAYMMAVAAAISWALYCTLTKRYGGGKNGVSLFLLVTGGVLWLNYFFSAEPAMSFSLKAAAELAFMAISTGVAYSCWDVGIQKGNMTLLATASYFTPIFSMLIASVWLNTPLSYGFWQGVAMVSTGSILCWLAIRGRGEG